MIRTASHLHDASEVEETVNADMSGRLADLRARFVARSAKDVARIEELTRMFSLGDSAAVYELERLSHKLAGSAGSFGYPELGIRASAVEYEAEKLRAASGDPSGLQAAVWALKDALSADNGTHGS